MFHSAPTAQKNHGKCSVLITELLFFNHKCTLLRPEGIAFCVHFKKNITTEICGMMNCLL